jgi:CheY-like chemotaxis protein/REP element-mobilizing transposase RayT
MMPIRLLIINRQLRYAIRLKQALEQAGGYEVSPFTAVDTALDQLRGQRYDVALLDFTFPTITPGEIVRRIRTIQPNIAIIASPKTSTVTALVTELRLDGIADMPSTARQLIPIIRQALREAEDALSDTAEAPAVTDESDTIQMEPPRPDHPPEFSSLDSILVNTGGLDPSAGGETSDLDADGEDRQADDRERSQSIEFVLTGEINELKDLPRTESEAELDDTEKDRAAEVFQQLAAEEPPPPLEDSGTVGDLMAGVGDADLEEVARVLMQDQLPAPPAPLPAGTEPSEGDDDTPAEMILKTALDDSSPLGISLRDLLRNIEDRFPEDAGGIKPLPSWVREVERYVDEPDFLAGTVPQPGEVLPDDEPTVASDPQAIAQHPESMETEPLSIAGPRDPGEIVAEPEPPPPPATLPEAPALGDSEEMVTERMPPEEAPPEVRAAEEIAERMPPEEPTPEIDSLADTPVAGTVEEHDELPEADLSPPVHSRQEEHALADDRVTVGTGSEDPHIARLALSLTQASLELTAEATLLARDDEIVAYTGSIPFEEITDLRETIADDWNAGPGEARIRFLTLPGSGQDYMLYSRPTEDGFVLSMIFAGNLPLRVIRRQSDRLIHALQTVPELPAEVISEADDLQELEQLAAAREAEAQESTSRLMAIQREDLEAADAADQAAEAPDISRAEPKTAYTYLWLVRDPEHPLTEPVAQAIVNQLDEQLNRQRWTVQDLHVFEDYVYLIAETPADKPAHEIIAELKKRSAQIAQSVDSSFDPDSLWADAYFALMPGRALHTEEIQRFIHFGRLQ